MTSKATVFLCLLVFFGVISLDVFPLYWAILLGYAGISALVVIGLVVLSGVAGLISFGQAIFVGLGGYGTALLTMKLALSPFVALPIVVVMAAGIAFVIAAMTLSLKGHYLAVATLAWNVSFFYLVGNLDFVGRHDGISGIPPISESFADPKAALLLIFAATFLALLASRNLLASRVGRAIRSLQGGVLAAESCGINTRKAKMLAFVYAAVLTSLAGWFYAHFQRTINPSSFGLGTSIDYLTMALIGGIQSVFGALIGVSIVTALREALQQLLGWAFHAQGSVEAIVLSALLILMLHLAPNGFWPRLASLGRGGLFRHTLKRVPPRQEPSPRRLPPTRGTELLVVRRLSKSFGGLKAVRDVSFTLKAGEIVGLIGPNGAGKSTTFNMVSGLLLPSTGEVFLMGQSITGRRARDIARLGLARSFQHVKIVPGMTVLENVALGCHLAGKAGAVSAIFRTDCGEEERLFAVALEQIERVGLGPQAHRLAGTLPLGQQRMVEIARALCLDPILLLLDEPAAGLRHFEKVVLGQLLAQLACEGLTILLVEHDMEFIMGLTDRTIVMSFGEILAHGTANEIQNNPAVIEAYLGVDA